MVSRRGRMVCVCVGESADPLGPGAGTAPEGAHCPSSGPHSQPRAHSLGQPRGPTTWEKTPRALLLATSPSEALVSSDTLLPEDLHA